MAGDKFDIIAAITESGNCPFWDEFFLPLLKRYNESMSRKGALDNRDQTNFRITDHYFNKFSKTGPWKNIHQIRPIENGFLSSSV